MADAWLPGVQQQPMSSPAAGPTTPSRWRRGCLRAVLLAGLVAMLVSGVWLVRRYVYVNVATVAAGQVYRCAQPTGRSLEHLVNRYGIATVVNLRGAHPEEVWYQDEVAFCQTRHLHHYDISFSAHAWPSADLLLTILDILHDAPRPLLIHCRAGADRTGLVSAFYHIAEQHEPVDQARRELSLLHGHWRWGATWAMDAVLDLYAARGGGLSLRSWIDGDYRRSIAGLAVVAADRRDD